MLSINVMKPLARTSNGMTGLAGAPRVMPTERPDHILPQLLQQAVRAPGGGRPVSRWRSRWRRWTLRLAALLYVLWPLDLLPDWLPLALGYVDDLLVVWFTWRTLRRRRTAPSPPTEEEPLP